MTAKKSPVSGSRARAKHLTVRGVPKDVADALQVERRRRATSVNATVINLLRQALGLNHAEVFDNGLGRLAGTWTKRDLDEFEQDTKHFETIDPDLWQ